MVMQTTTRRPDPAGHWVYGVYVEPHYDACLTCPMVGGCDDESPECPRRQAKLRELREARIIPRGSFTLEEAAARVGVCTETVRAALRHGHLPFKQIRDRRWVGRVVRVIDLDMWASQRGGRG